MASDTNIKKITMHSFSWDVCTGDMRAKGCRIQLNHGIKNLSIEQGDTLYKADITNFAYKVFIKADGDNRNSEVKEYVLNYASLSKIDIQKAKLHY
jgi:hypothetical protein